MAPLALLAAVLIAARWIAQLSLELLNRRHVQAHAGAVPEAFRDTMDRPTYDRAVEYTLARNRFGSIELTWSTLVLFVVLFSGILPAAWNHWISLAGTSAWAGAAGLFLGGVILSLPSLPLDWWQQFRLEQRFGFNTTTLGTWIVDRIKTLALAAALGIPLIAFLLKLVEWTGSLWWLWGWGALMVFQGIMLVLAPVVIMPLFNKFTPLPDGTLKARLLDLARRTGFVASSIEVMDGSRRSRHANAFFTGLGKFRKIVLFDTLISQLGEPELEAVLAHEIGHYRLRHIPKLLAWSAVMTLGAFAAIAWLAGEPRFFAAFGFTATSVPVALLLFTLLSEAVTFWFSPLSHILSRRFEYQADAYAAQAVGEFQSLVRALRKLHEKNLSNLTPHPLYSGFYYSHPTLLEREAALTKP
jgi:STE24 endopeptidase